MALIVAENITKDYHVGEVTVRALKGVSFNIDPGSFISFVGPSGSGKTTLLNLIGCLDKPSGGRLLVAGVNGIDGESVEFTIAAPADEFVAIAVGNGREVDIIEDTGA